MSDKTVLYRGLDKSGEHVEYVYLPEPEGNTVKAVGPTLHKTVLSPEDSSPGAAPPLATKFLRNRRLLVINSTTSGQSQSTLVYKNILQPLLEGLGITHEYVPTRDANTITRTAQTGLVAGQDYLIVIFGGDTSLSEFVNELAASGDSSTAKRGRIDFVLVPTGTGNAIAVSSIGGGKNAIAKTIATLFNSSNETRDGELAEAVDSTAQGIFVPLPTVRVEFPSGSHIANSSTPSVGPLQLYAVAVVSWALHAALVADSDLPEYRGLGVVRFSKSAELNLGRDQCYRGDIALLPPFVGSDKSSSSSIKVAGDKSTHSYVLFSLVSQVEQGYFISPSTRYGHTNSDGRPDFYFVRIPFELPNNENNAELTRLVTLPRQQGAHVKDPNVDYVYVNPSVSDRGADGVAGVITIAPGQGPQRWCVDGLIVVVPDAEAPVVVHGARGGIEASGWNLNILV